MDQKKPDDNSSGFVLVFFNSISGYYQFPDCCNALIVSKFLVMELA